MHVAFRNTHSNYVYLKDVSGEFGYVTDLGVDLSQTLAIAAKRIALQVLHSKSDTVYDYLNTVCTEYCFEQKL
jgi:hypothetical protein